jgi:hypothetical protein
MPWSCDPNFLSLDKRGDKGEGGRCGGSFIISPAGSSLSHGCLSAVSNTHFLF